MNKLRLIALGTGSLLVAGSAILVACSSEDTVVNPVDSGTDSPADVGPKPDTGTEDAGPDAAPPFDGGTEKFTDLLATALCKAATRCCFGDATTKGDAGVDGGHYDEAKCLDLYRQTGFEGSLHGIDKVDAGLLTLDQQQAGNCLAHAEALSCNVPGAELAQLRTECFNAFYSTAPAGSHCANSAACGKGLFCNTSVDGGTCEATRGDGGACGDWTTDKTLIDESCTWRGMGGDQFCQFYTAATMAAWPNASDELDAGQYFCAPANATGGPCNSDVWCKAGVCDTNTTFSCQSPAIIFPPVGFCNLLVKP